MRVHFLAASVFWLALGGQMLAAGIVPGPTFIVFAQSAAETGLSELLAVGTGLASSLILGTAKRYTGILDTKIGKAVKPFQPGVVLGLSLLLPWASNAIGITAIPDPVIFANAPVASLVGITAREILVRFLTKKKKL